MPSNPKHLNSLRRFDLVAVVLESPSRSATAVAVDLSYEDRASGGEQAVPTLVLSIQQAKALAQALNAAVNAFKAGDAIGAPFG